MLSDKLLEIKEISDMGITMSDGCRLSARVWMPVNAESTPVPAILEFLPYRKRDGTSARDCLTHPYFAKRGYACIRVDMRGNGDSEGIMFDEYTKQELDDAEFTVNWLAAQDWCSGVVGMMGISWGGFNSLQVAERAPDPLKAIITLCSSVDRYAEDIHYKGGCLLNENFGWGSTMWSYSSRAPDPEIVGDVWKQIWIERLRQEPFLPLKWLAHQNRDAYWKNGSVCENYDAIVAATLAIGGWGDAYKNAVSSLVENLSCPVKGIVGPWIHKYPHFAIPEPRIGFLQEALRWWDHWLKGLDRSVENDAAYTVYLMDGLRPQTQYENREGRWISEDNWPDKISKFSWQCGANGALSNALEGQLDLGVKVNSPQDCGLDSGEYCAIWAGAEMPGDQQIDDTKSACFTSLELSEHLDIVGAPKIRLSVSSDKTAAQIAVRLNHIHPDGASTRITYGLLNLAHRKGFGMATPLVPGEVFNVDFSLDQIAYRVPAGHKIRVSISSSYWPLIWPSPESVCLTLEVGSIEVPIRPSGKADERHFSSPVADLPWQTEEIRPASNSRKAIKDMKTGITTIEVIDDFGSIRDCQHGLVSGSVAREWWSIHPDDPLSAEARTHWSTENSRGAWSVRTETFAKMTSDKEMFYLEAKLEAYEGEKLVFEKEICQSVPRNHR